MKNILAILFVLTFSFLLVKTANAAPFKAALQNPNIVAFYETGDHGIPGEAFLHQGKDLVMKDCTKCGNFQQWFVGKTEEPCDSFEGEHSVWRNVGEATTCPRGWTLMVSPYPAWGDYLTPGANYCVHNNDFLR